MNEKSGRERADEPYRDATRKCPSKKCMMQTKRTSSYKMASLSLLALCWTKTNKYYKFDYLHRATSTGGVLKTLPGFTSIMQPSQSEQSVFLLCTEKKLSLLHQMPLS